MYMYRKQLCHLTHCPTLLAALVGEENKVWPSQIHQWPDPMSPWLLSQLPSAVLIFLSWWGGERGLWRLPVCLGELGFPVAWVCLAYSSLMVFCNLTHSLFLFSLGKK